MKFYRCSVCGQVIEIIRDTRRIPVCCDEDMLEISPITKESYEPGTPEHDAKFADSNMSPTSAGLMIKAGKDLLELHLPVIETDGNLVTVCAGNKEHPMTESHHIEWIALETRKGYQRKKLKAGDKPCACFCLCEDDEVIAAYTYCNLHRLYKQ